MEKVYGGKRLQCILSGAGDVEEHLTLRVLDTLYARELSDEPWNFPQEPSEDDVAAGSNLGYALHYIPKNLITEELAELKRVSDHEWVEKPTYIDRILLTMYEKLTRTTRNAPPPEDDEPLEGALPPLKP